MNPMCAVSNCPSLRDGRRMFCRPHQEAVLAKTVGATKHRCEACKRPIKPDDYVRREMVKRAVIKSKPGAPYGWQHAVCAPTPLRGPSKQQRRASVKPLFAAVDCE